MLAGSHRNAWPDETGTGGRTNRNTHQRHVVIFSHFLQHPDGSTESGHFLHADPFDPGVRASG